MTQQLPERAKALLDAPEFATIATIDPDGQPHLSVVWIGRDGDDVLVSTTVGRRKHRNLVRDPRVSVLVYPKSDPHHFVSIQGSATLTEEPADPAVRALIDRFAREYKGLERYTADDATGATRVTVRIRPEKVVVYGG